MQTLSLALLILSVKFQKMQLAEMASVAGNHSQAMAVICFLLSEASSVTN